MLKFKNRNEPMNLELEFRISMMTTQGGLRVEVDQHCPDTNNHKAETIDMTPMDAACFIGDVRASNGLSCRQVGHSSDGRNATIEISAVKPLCCGEDWRFVGGCSDVFIEVGDICMTAPAFVVDAIRLAMEGMMTSLLYPSTGDFGEEFG